jgi:DNA polymerase zeta
MKYESKDQRKPDFEAKGLETIRRDQCTLTQNILRDCLILLYKSGIESVHSYLCRQWSLILAGNVSVSDFILTGKVRSRYRGGRIGPVQAVLARRLSESDPGRVVRHKQRQPYIIVATPGVSFRLKDCVLTPMELLEQWDTYTIHSTYYITKHVNAALQRCLSLAPYFIDVASWYDKCPKPRGRIHYWPATKLKANSTIMISSFFGSDICSLCNKKCMSQGRSRAAVCKSCRDDPVQACATALNRLNSVQNEASYIATQCRQCNHCFEDATTFASVTEHGSSVTAGRLGTKLKISTSVVVPLANCTCIDCPVLFDRHSLREKEMEAFAVCQALDLM